MNENEKDAQIIKAFMDKYENATIIDEAGYSKLVGSGTLYGKITGLSVGSYVGFVGTRNAQLNGRGFYEPRKCWDVKVVFTHYCPNTYRKRMELLEEKPADIEVPLITGKLKGMWELPKVSKRYYSTNESKWDMKRLFSEQGKYKCIYFVDAHLRGHLNRK